MDRKHVTTWCRLWVYAEITFAPECSRGCCCLVKYTIKGLSPTRFAFNICIEYYVLKHANITGSHSTDIGNSFKWCPHGSGPTSCKRLCDLIANVMEIVSDFFRTSELIKWTVCTYYCCLRYSRTEIRKYSTHTSIEFEIRVRTV